MMQKTLLTMLTTVIFLGSCFPDSSDNLPDINADLIAYYPFNGDASDQSGNGNNGIVNGATLTSDRFGNPNSAYEFDGQDDFIALPSNLTLLETDFTISVLLKPDDYGKKSATSSFCARTIFSHRFRAHKNSDPMNSGLIMRLTKGRGCDGNNFFSGRFIDPNFQYNPITYQYTEANAYDWFHYTLIREKDTMTIYLNGRWVSQVAVSPEPIYLNPNQTVTAIGAAIHQNNRLFFPFDGVLDDIRIYGRALEKTEVQELYQACCAAK